jgi:GT2 family glycosyltransferase
MISRKLGIVILNYNGSVDTLNCVKSIRNIDVDDPIIIVDNHSDENDYQNLKKNIAKEAIIIRTEKNLGYAGGNNVGIKKALELQCKYICVINNDTVVVEDIFSPCIDVLTEDRKIAFVSPTIVDFHTGLVQVAGSSINPTTGIVKNFNMNRKPSELGKFIFCDYVSGACIMCRSEIVDEIGYIPECYFLFFEETEWCYAARRNGYKNLCLANTKILHKGSVSINKVGGLQTYLMLRNRIAFMRRNTKCKFASLLVYHLLCVREFAKFVLTHKKRYLLYIKAYSDGWNKKVSNRYPFIIINND